MARMYPEEIEGYEKATEGKKEVFRFLREAARPHKDYRCWYEPPIGEQQREPDFVLFSKRLNLTANPRLHPAPLHGPDLLKT